MGERTHSRIKSEITGVMSRVCSHKVKLHFKKMDEDMNKKYIGSWLDSRSVFFSRISGERITRRDVILTHTIVIGMMVGGFLFEHYPLVSLVAVAVVALSIKRLNKD